MNPFQLLILFQILICVVWSAPPGLKTEEPVDTEIDVPCLQEFYNAVYNGDYNCTMNFDFLSNDPRIQREALTTGKSCFLTVIEGECSRAQYTYFSNNSDEIVKTLTENSADAGPCTDSSSVYNLLKCTPSMKAISIKATTMAMAPPKKINDTNLLALIDLCDKVQTCMKSDCPLLELATGPLDKLCEMFRITNSVFGICFTNIQKHPPKSSKYTCLEGQDPISKDSKLAEMLTTKKECIKEIMVDSCGEGVLEDFDEKIETFVSALEMSETMRGDMLGGL